MSIMHEIPTPLREVRSAGRSNDLSGQRCKESEYGASQLADLVHELRQPLSTIEALTSYLELVNTDAKMRSFLERIQDMLLQANYILERASDADFH